MPLVCHENYPNLVLKTKVFAIEKIVEPSWDGSEEGTAPYGEGTISKLWGEANTAYEDFEQQGNLEALEQAISQFQAIVNAIPEDDSRLPQALNNLGAFLHSRFEQLGHLDDLNRGIEMLQRAISLTPQCHRDRPGYLTNLGDSLRVRFERLGNLADIDDAITQCQASVNLAPDGHSEKPSYLSNLGSCFQARFEQFGNPADLDNAIIQHQAAVNLTPDGHSDKPIRLINFGNSLQTRFEHLGNLADLDNAIIQNQAAVNLTPDGHPSKPGRLNNLGSSLQGRFRRLGNVVDINDAITQNQAAVNLTPDGHPHKPSHLNNLGNSLRVRFKWLGDLADLDNAIEQSQAAINTTPNDHPAKPNYLTNLGGSLETRFERLGNPADLDAAILHERAAVNLTPDGHPEKPSYLNNLAISLETRFQRLGDIIDLDDAIAQSQAAVNLTPDGHPGKPSNLNTLGFCFRARFQRLGNLDDLNAAISQEQAAINLTPGHPNAPGYLSNLGISLQSRYEQLGNQVDLDNAMEVYQKAVNLTSDSLPDKATRLNNFGNFLQMLFHRFREPYHAEMAIYHLSSAAMSPVGRPSTRFEAAEGWISMASALDHPSLLAAYECALGLIPLVAWLGLSMTDRYQHLAKIGGIARDAAAAAISLEKYDTALEWLEQGRSVVWTQLLHLRTPVDELYEVNPDLADQLLRISRLLEQGGGQNGLSGKDLESIEEQGRLYRALTMEWESIIEQIRMLPSFENFLRPPNSRRLMSAAKRGPVVIVNIAKKRCDALAIRPGQEDIIHIPLPNVTSELVTELKDELKEFLYSSGIRSRGERAATRVTGEADEQTCERVLAELWNNLVQPVLGLLEFSVRVSQNCISELANGLIFSLIQKYFHGSGGVPPDRWPFCLYMQQAYMVENHQTHR
jgi:tetratricopeptide (TPR) repeat protein